MSGTHARGGRRGSSGVGVGVGGGVALALGLALAACGAGPQRDLLMESVTTYNEGVRWERFSAAAAAVPPAEREAFLDEREELAEDLRITDYEVVRVTTKGDHADIQVKLTWFLDSRGSVHDTWIRQRWERRGRSWRVVDERRVRGEAMPGLAEQTDDEAAEAAKATAAAPAGT
jgi:hypothetical protein